MIRVPVPIDFGTIEAAASDVFAATTPLRVAELLALAVREALGTRAPLDKLERGIRKTLTGFVAGDFVVYVDGRAFRRLDDVVMCSDVATLRFFGRPRESGLGAVAGTTVNELGVQRVWPGEVVARERLGPVDVERLVQAMVSDVGVGNEV